MCNLKMQHKTIHIDSNDREEGTKISNAVYHPQHNQTINGKIQVNKVNIPYTFYQIDYFNQWIDYSDSNGDHSVAIPAGNYNTTNLSTTLQTLLSNGGLTYSVTYNSIQGHYTITVDSGNFQFLFESGPNSNNAANVILGFNKIDTTLASSQISTNYPNLSPINYLYIKSRMLYGGGRDVINGAFSMNKNDQNIIAKVPITVNPGGIIQYTIDETCWYDVGIQSIRDIDIQLTFPNNIEVNLNGNNWDMTLLCMTNKQE